jgi:hypothetical protein
MKNQIRLPSLRSGHGLPTRQIVLCDGRTSARFDDRSGGLDHLVHYAPDSFVSLKDVWRAPGQAATWSIDGAAFRFDWVEAWPFGFTNRWNQKDVELNCHCLIEQGYVAWRFRGIQNFAAFRVPLALWEEHHEEEDGIVLEDTAWRHAHAADADGCWRTVREEKWLYRDRSTYAGIAGQKIAAHPGSSKLHLCLAASLPLQVEYSSDALTFLVPARNGEVLLALGLGSDAAEAERNARSLSDEFDMAWARQCERYAAIAESTPLLDWGRHRALNRFFRLTPLYLESLRVRDEMAAFRANNDYHWVWGWDMTRPAFGLLACNRHEPVRGLLEFRGRVRNPNGSGIEEYDSALGGDLRYSEGCNWQEVMLAHAYLAWTGDEAGCRASSQWMKAQLEDALERADPVTGMFAGTMASTDFPEEFGRTFQAWLAYPTGWQYNALCGAEKLFLRWGQPEFAARLRALAARVKANFHRVFWNGSTGFWNEGVHPTDPLLVCDIPLSTATAMMDGPYGEDLLGARLAHAARYTAQNFLRDDGVHITRAGEVRGWKEWTRQANNWFAANDTMVARLLRAAGDFASLEKLFSLYDLNFAAHPCGFEGKPFARPLEISSSWQAFGAAAWQRNLVEAGAGLWAHLGGLMLVPCGLREPLQLERLRFCGGEFNFEAEGNGAWPCGAWLNGEPLRHTLQLPRLTSGSHNLRVEYSLATPARPLLLGAIDARVLEVESREDELHLTLAGAGYTPITFYAPSPPRVVVNGCEVACEWNAVTGRGFGSALL